MPLILLQPIWTLFCLLVFYIFWLAVLIALATADYASKEKKKMVAMYKSDGMARADFATFTTIDYSKPAWIQYKWWYLLIAFIWTSEFILSCQQMVIAG